MCRPFGLSRPTLRQTLAALSRRGLIVAHQREGTFNADPDP
jgi:DNA-binding GntR family transcriptional regulator